MKRRAGSVLEFVRTLILRESDSNCGKTLFVSPKKFAKLVAEFDKLGGDQHWPPVHEISVDGIYVRGWPELSANKHLWANIEISKDRRSISPRK